MKDDDEADHVVVAIPGLPTYPAWSVVKWTLVSVKASYIDKKIDGSQTIFSDFLEKLFRPLLVGSVAKKVVQLLAPYAYKCSYYGDKPACVIIHALQPFPQNCKIGIASYRPANSFLDAAKCFLRI